jgi:hypothetical protein
VFAENSMEHCVLGLPAYVAGAPRSHVLSTPSPVESPLAPHSIASTESSARSVLSLPRSVGSISAASESESLKGSSRGRERIVPCTLL